ncbi:MAG: hypothetical protein ACI3Y2_01510 [Candidatus Egerieousia sp.]
MRTIRTLLMVFTVMLFADAMSAQNNVTPEQIAQAEASQLHKMLNFTDGQYRRVYRALVSEARTLLEEKDGFFRGKGSGKLRPEFDNGKSAKVKLSGEDERKLIDTDFDSLDGLRTSENREESKGRVEAKMKSILSDYQFVLYLRYQKANEEKLKGKTAAAALEEKDEGKSE